MAMGELFTDQSEWRPLVKESLIDFFRGVDGSVVKP
jgi:hypothetical protein